MFNLIVLWCPTFCSSFGTEFITSNTFSSVSMSQWQRRTLNAVSYYHNLELWCCSCWRWAKIWVSKASKTLSSWSPCFWVETRAASRNLLQQLLPVDIYKTRRSKYRYMTSLICFHMSILVIVTCLEMMPLNYVIVSPVVCNERVRTNEWVFSSSSFTRKIRAHSDVRVL
jgi:hypothetical protein